MISPRIRFCRSIKSTPSDASNRERYSTLTLVQLSIPKNSGIRVNPVTSQRMMSKKFKTFLMMMGSSRFHGTLMTCRDD